METNKHEATPAEENARQLANSFATSRVQEFVEKLHKELATESGGVVWVESKVKKQLGILLSTAYFKGYIDRHEGSKLRKLYL
jgi:hypothetical protein